MAESMVKKVSFNAATAKMKALGNVLQRPSGRSLASSAAIIPSALGCVPAVIRFWAARVSSPSNAHVPRNHSAPARMLYLLAVARPHGIFTKFMRRRVAHTRTFPIRVGRRFFGER